MNDVVYSIIAAGGGAALGPLLRYGLGLPVNSDAPAMPVSALVINLIAAYFVGAAAGVFDVLNLPSLWKLLFIAVLSAGLATFSSFSGELLARLRDGRLGWSALMLVLHVGGSLAMTLAGMACLSLIRGPG
jgi:CrcB protein